MIRNLCFCSCLILALIVCSSVASHQAFAAEQVVYATGFEDNNGQYAVGVVASDVKWEWGAPNTSTKTAGPTTCNSGQKCWGTSMTELITGTGTLTSPTITVPALAPGQMARVSFFAYIDVPVMAASSGYADIYVSSDNQQTWKKLARLLEKMAGGWQRYDFDISEFAGQSINIQFNTFVISSTPSPGLYVDDVALTIVDVPSPTKTLTLTAWEDPSPSASCPWVFTWDGTNFVQDNDIYSVARYERGKMRDFYLLQKPLLAQQGSYNLEVREIETETSFTDMVALRTIDHAPDVAVAPDSRGNVFAFKPAELLPPASARSSTGSDVLAQISKSKDSSGFQAFSGDFIDLDFGAVNTAAGARLVLRIKGFLVGDGAVKPFTGPPAILVQRQNSEGDWQEVGRLNPRFDWSIGAFDLAPFIPVPAGTLKVRLSSISHATKYHEIDFVALSVGAQPQLSVNELLPRVATYGGTDVAVQLSTADNQYVRMGTGNKFSVSFDAQSVQAGQTRDFVLVSEGYYIPSGDTFFLYTWDGNKWSQRDAVSFTTAIGTFDTKQFNLSSYLPDPDGEYKVRIWQDYCYETASIDFVGMKVDTIDGSLATATDLRTGTDVKSFVETTDNSGFFYDYGQTDSTGVRPRNRWTEFNWTGLPTHVPPTVPKDQLRSLGGNIRWGYYSPTQDTQAGFDIQVWTGAGATGAVMWSPPTFSGPSDWIRYTGSILTPGATYYLRIRLYDGKAWGGWVEIPFVAPKRNGVILSGGTIPDILDALQALKIVVKLVDITDAYLDGGDIAPLDPATGIPIGDGKIDLYDVIGILRKVVGL